MSANFWFKVYYFLCLPLTAIILAIIGIYRLTVRYALRGNCNFIPTCSKYGWDSVCEFGAIWGGVLTIKRLLKCTPNHKAGLDLPKLNLMGNYKWKC